MTTETVASSAAWLGLALLLAALIFGLRRHRAKTLMSLFTLVLVLILAEVALRLTYPPSWRPVRKTPSAKYHHVTRPNRTMYEGWFEGRHLIARTNEDGLRSKHSRRAFLEYRRRIAVLGDSFTFGNGVRQEAAFPQVMQQRLRWRLGDDDLAVLNAGTTSYSPLLGLRVYDGVIVHYRPQLVLYVLDVTDIGDDYNYEKELVEDGSGGYFDWENLKVTRYYGALGQLANLNEVVEALDRPVTALRTLWGYEPPQRYRWYGLITLVGRDVEVNRFFIYRHPLEETSRHFERSWGYLSALAESVHRSGGEFILVVSPRFHHWNPDECPENRESKRHGLNDPYQYEYFRFFEQRRNTAPFEIINLLPAFQATDEYPLVFRDDPHWNEAGHAFVARVLADHLIESRRFVP